MPLAPFSRAESIIPSFEIAFAPFIRGSIFLINLSVSDDLLIASDKAPKLISLI